MSISNSELRFDISKYEEVRSLGSGAFSDVFLYQLRGKPEKGEPVKIAIKMPRADHSDQDRLRDGEYLRGEAEVIRKLASDEHSRFLVVTLYHSGNHPISREPYLALEAFATEDGWQRLDKIVSELSLGEALKVLGKIAQLLQVQQKNGIINPDLKLDSFFVHRASGPMHRPETHQVEPDILVKATDFNTTTTGAPSSPEWQKVRRAFAEVISYVLSQGRSRVFLAFTLDQQPIDEEITAEEDRLVPQVARGLIIAALRGTDFGGIEARLKAVYQEYQAQFKGLVNQVLAALEEGQRDQAQELLWDKILKESLPLATVDKAREQMLRGEVEPTLDLSQALPPELKGVPWLTVWAHVVAPPAKFIKERSESEPNYFVPLYRHFLNNLRSNRIGDALCSLLLIAPLPYDGSFASWIEQKGQKNGEQCCPVCEEITGFKKQLRSQKENMDEMYKQVIQELNNANAEMYELQQKGCCRDEQDEEVCKNFLKEAQDKVEKAQNTSIHAVTALSDASSYLDEIWWLVNEDRDKKKIDGLKAQLAEVAKLVQEANDLKKHIDSLPSRQRELISQLQKEERQ